MSWPGHHVISLEYGVLLLFFLFFFGMLGMVFFGAEFGYPRKEVMEMPRIPKAPKSLPLKGPFTSYPTTGKKELYRSLMVENALGKARE
jgi:hypothetical protein